MDDMVKKNDRGSRDALGRSILRGGLDRQGCLSQKFESRSCFKSSAGIGSTYQGTHASAHSVSNGLGIHHDTSTISPLDESHDIASPSGSIPECRRCYIISMVSFFPCLLAASIRSAPHMAHPAIVSGSLPTQVTPIKICAPFPVGNASSIEREGAWLLRNIHIY